MSIFLALLIISSYVFIYFGPVPYTLQTLFIFLTGLFLGEKLAPATVFVWIILGLAGIPVFAGGKAGLLTVVKPTGGFLIGFIFATWVIGLVLKKFGVHYYSILGSMLIGLVVIYMFGTAGVYFSFQYFLNEPISLSDAFKMGCIPFIIPDLLKVFLASLIGYKGYSILHKMGKVPV